LHGDSGIIYGMSLIITKAVWHSYETFSGKLESPVSHQTKQERDMANGEAWISLVL
jgi:hypothetical protein